ncbi:hypothetical protein HanRHA438_Chr04g0193681 [Helianthus annuus]|nr:hypothetical protein HanRHA438_Chr04g0193681 [Helianthus annuus]
MKRVISVLHKPLPCQRHIINHFQKDHSYISFTSLSFNFRFEYVYKIDLYFDLI